MSKSLGNGIDPLDLIDQYGADALRYALVNGTAPGHDQRFQQEKIEAGRNFINKIWNALRFVVMNHDQGMDFSAISPDDLALEDCWILSTLQTLKEEATANLEKYELGIALGKIYSFIWDDYCDWFIEMSKARLQEKEGSKNRLTAQFVLTQVLGEAMQLLHPFMPFLSEAVWQHLKPETAAGSIMITQWPQPEASLRFPQQEAAMANLMEAIRSIRTVRSDLHVPPGRKAALIVVSTDPAIRQNIADGRAFLQRLAGIESIRIQQDKQDVPPTAVAALFPGGELYLPLSDLIDLNQEIERLEKEKENLVQELERVRQKLANEQFISRAPEKVVQTEKDKLARYTAMDRKAAERLAQLQEAKEGQ